MNTKKIGSVKTSKVQTDKLGDAKLAFEKMQADIAPFIKKRKFASPENADQWVDTYSLDVMVG